MTGRHILVAILIATVLGMAAGTIWAAVELVYFTPETRIIYLDEHPVACRAPGTPPGNPPLPVCPWTSP